MITLSYKQDPPTHPTEHYDWFEKDKKFTINQYPKTGDIDLSVHATDTDQLNIGACAGNATTDGVEILFNMKSPSAPKLELSRLFVYALARTLDGTLDKDDGTYVRSCFEVLKRFGICEEKDWPYDTSKVFISPSLVAQRAALGHKIHSFYRIKSVGEDRVTEVMHALNSGHPVVFGTLIDKSFMSLSKNSPPVTIPSSDIVGGHAMLIVGVKGNNFKVKNSWGTQWGQNGYWWMTEEYLKWANTWDLWVPAIENPQWLDKRVLPIPFQSKAYKYERRPKTRHSV